MTDRSQDEMWGLTKRFNANKTKWCGKNWTWSAYSTDGRLNASQAANTIGVSVRREKGAKGKKRTFTMSLKSKAKNGIKKAKKDSQGCPAGSTMDIGRDPHRAAKIIQKQLFISE